MFKVIPDDLSDLITKMLVYLNSLIDSQEFDANTRISIKEALQHSFFERVRDPSSEIELDTPLDWVKLDQLSSMDMNAMSVFLNEEFTYWEHKQRD